MLELVRGYAAAVLDEAGRGGSLEALGGGLSGLRSLLVSSEPLRRALTDPSVPSSARSALLSDLLAERAQPGVAALATFVAAYERAGELPGAIEMLLELAETRQAEVAAGAGVAAEPPIGRAGALERLRGFAERVFEGVSEQSAVDGIEDDLFRLARLAESRPELGAALSGPEAPLPARLQVLEELLRDKVGADTIALAGYVLRCGRSRDLVGALDYLVELAAAERGRRVAHVKAAVALDDDERARLAEALGARMRRPVELRVVVDPAVLGGLDVAVGDTVIDGTVRHRLDQLRDTILQLD